MTKWKVTVLTLFPESFPGPLNASIIGKSLNEQHWILNVINIRDFSYDKHITVDDTPFGGGPGMIIRSDVINAALEKVVKQEKPEALIYLSPRGKLLNQSKVENLANLSNICLLCGRFEGIDQRVIDYWNIEEMSIGDFILSGGEIAAMCLIESCVRLLPNVVGKKNSLKEESFSNGLLEYPQYTKPRNWKGINVPEVLLSGHHKKIQNWRQNESEKLTKNRRPDLWSDYIKYKD